MLKIIFLCGSLEPGKDGVGDYCRLFALELVKQGHKVALISLNDHFIASDNLSAHSGTKTPVLRLCASGLWHERIEKAKDFIQKFNPNWISLQFVAFSFQDKGLPYQLPKRLKALSGNAKWHIMFHELWVEDFDFKSRLLRFLQQSIIKKIVKTLKPGVVHTHLPIYSVRLLKLGIKNQGLPIFSNIKLNQNIVPGAIAKFENDFIIGFFSQSDYREEIIDFLTKLIYDVVKHKFNIKVVFIGGSENSIKELCLGVKGIKGISEVLHTGFLDVPELSATLSQCNIGISPVPCHLIGKSGSVAAFLNHGVPIAAPYKKPGFEDIEIGLFSDIISNTIVTSPGLQEVLHAQSLMGEIHELVDLKTISKGFINDLSK